MDVVPAVRRPSGVSRCGREARSRGRQPLEQCRIAYEILNSWMRVAGLRLNGYVLIAAPETCRIRNPQPEEPTRARTGLGRRPDSASSVRRGFPALPILSDGAAGFSPVSRWAACACETNASHKHSVPESATSWARTASASTINARALRAVAGFRRPVAGEHNIRRKSYRTDESHNV